MKNKQPMFSIIMPCYNHGEFVEVAITSILEQTYQDFELIVADNGSNDNSWEIIQKYQDRIKCFQLEQNDFKKCTEMMMDMSTGKYLAQMAADDYWYPDKLELQVKAMEENPNCYAYFTWAAFTDENLNITDDKLFSYKNRSRYEWFKTIFVHGTVLAINTMVTVNDKQKWLDYSQGVMNYRQLPDQMVFLQMLLNGDDIDVIPKICMKVRRHENCIGAISRDTSVRTLNETILIWNEMWELMDDEFFVKAFYEDLINPNVTDKDEILCEKMLVFLNMAEKYILFQGPALIYFTRHYLDKNITKILETKYNYTREKFFEFSGRSGFGNLYYALSDSLEIQKFYQEKVSAKELQEEYIKIAPVILELCQTLGKKITVTLREEDITDFLMQALNDYISAVDSTMNEYNQLLYIDTNLWDESKRLIKNMTLHKIENIDTVIHFLNLHEIQLKKVLERGENK